MGYALNYSTAAAAFARVYFAYAPALTFLLSI